MEKIKISRGFTPKLAGRPDASVIRLPFPSTLGLSAQDIPFIRAKLLVKEGDAVKTGTPLFTDKNNPSLFFVSPATGRVKAIVFGPRRRLMEVVVAAQEIDEFVPFEALSPEQVAELPKAELADHLKKGGLWQGLRQFPAGDTADADHVPAMIIVSLDGNDIFSPCPDLMLERQEEAFLTGLALLERFSPRIVVTARQSSVDALAARPRIQEKITHVTDDTYPAWNPGAVLYQLKEAASDNSSWHIRLDHLLMMGSFLKTGKYPTHRMVSITRKTHQRPHLLIRQGTPIKQIAGVCPGSAPEEMITTGRFNGRIVSPDSHLGFFENTLNLIDHGPGEEMFGFVRPGLNKATASSTFLSALFPKRTLSSDCTLHGELRACINCSYCQRICPNEMMPSFIMKALHADEVEEALGLGLMDCCQCGLCSFTCPSKIELAKILRDGMDAHYKDKA